MLFSARRAINLRSLLFVLFLEYLSQTLDLLDDAQIILEKDKHRRESFYDEQETGWCHFTYFKIQ